MSTLLALCAACGTGTAVHAAPVQLAVWTFEDSVPGFAGPHMATFGVNSADAWLTAQHQDAAVSYTTPIGNGSQRAFAANRWKAGDFIEFAVSTAGYESIGVAWDWTRSQTATPSFQVQWSADGVQFNLLANELFIEPLAWSATTYNPDSFSGVIPLSSAADGLAKLHIRLIALADSPGTTGTVRFDNVQVTGMMIPAPGGALLLFGAGIPGRRRRSER